MITMLKGLMEKVDKMHEQNRNFSKDMEIRKNEMEMLEIKSPVIELQMPLTLVDSTEPKKESVNFKDKAIKIIQTETQRKKERVWGWVIEQNHPRAVRQY